MTAYANDDAPLVGAIVAAASDGRDFAGWLAGILASAAARMGGTAELLASRPGSWEASHVRDLLAGTVGAGDEYLSQYGEQVTAGWLVVTAVQPDGSALVGISAATLPALRKALAFAIEGKRPEHGGDHAEDLADVDAWTALLESLGGGA